MCFSATIDAILLYTTVAVVPMPPDGEKTKGEIHVRFLSHARHEPFSFPSRFVGSTETRKCYGNSARSGSKVRSNWNTAHGGFTVVGGKDCSTVKSQLDLCFLGLPGLD